MARVFIDDRWLKKSPDGMPPSSAATGALSNAKDPMKAKVPEKWRTTLYGIGRRWRCRWLVTGNDGIRRQRSRSFERKSDAEEFRAALEDDIRRGRYINPNSGDVLFNKIAQSWLEAKVNVRSSTLMRYQRELRCYILPMWGGRMLREITRGDLQRWVNSLAAGDYPAALSGGRKSRPLAARSIRSIVKVVMACILDHAVEDKLIRDNPARRVSLPRIVADDEGMVVLAIGEVEQLARAAEDIGSDVDGLLIRFQAGVGTRINEALALRVRDLDLAKSAARVRHTWTRTSGGRMKLDAPKNGRARTVAIPEFLIGPLKRQTAGCSKDEFVFRASHGGAINDGNWRNRVWSKALEHAGMRNRGVTIHSLRHTYASTAIASGADVKTLQRQLGHASATVTLDTYAVLLHDRPDVAQGINRAWQPYLQTPPVVKPSESETDSGVNDLATTPTAMPAVRRHHRHRDHRAFRLPGSVELAYVAGHGDHDRRHHRAAVGQPHVRPLSGTGKTFDITNRRRIGWHSACLWFAIVSAA